MDSVSLKFVNLDLGPGLRRVHQLRQATIVRVGVAVELESERACKLFHYCNNVVVDININNTNQ